MIKPWLYTGWIMHQRQRPVVNRFRYPALFVCVPLSRWHEARAGALRVEQPGLLSLHSKDHGARDGSPLLPWIRQLLATAGIHGADGEVWLSCFPRILGYVFNPVSFWYCENQAGHLIAVLAEVNNTFGERHLYLLAHEDQRPIQNDDWLTAQKVFHVSPFCAVAGYYRFQFRCATERRSVRIDYCDEAGVLIHTAITGSPQALTAANVLRTWLGQPWFTLGVMLRIHWQALRLWRKRVPFFRKPAPPLSTLSR
jgi:DUF1365 family protein